MSTSRIPVGTKVKILDNPLIISSFHNLRGTLVGYFALLKMNSCLVSWDPNAHAKIGYFGSTIKLLDENGKELFFPLTGNEAEFPTQYVEAINELKKEVIEDAYPDLHHYQTSKCCRCYIREYIPSHQFIKFDLQIQYLCASCWHDFRRWFFVAKNHY